MNTVKLKRSTIPCPGYFDGCSPGNMTDLLLVLDLKLSISLGQKNVNILSDLGLGTNCK